MIIDSSTSAVAVDDRPVGGDPRAGPDEHDVVDARGRESGTVSVPPPVTRSAVSGRSSASAASAPCAWAIERISSQWPRSMIVMRVASSHQISTSNRPSVPAQLVTKATTIASEIRVIMPGLPVAELARRAAEEDQAAVDEDDRAEDRGHEVEPGNAGGV